MLKSKEIIYPKFKFYNSIILSEIRKRLKYYCINIYYIVKVRTF